jgi:hypothetical protein
MPQLEVVNRWINQLESLMEQEHIGPYAFNAGDIQAPPQL